MGRLVCECQTTHRGGRIVRPLPFDYLPCRTPRIQNSFFIRLISPNP